MDKHKRGNNDDLVECLIKRLREEGAPAGTWLLDIETAQLQLRETQDLLLRLKNAIVRSATTTVPGLLAGAIAGDCQLGELLGQLPECVEKLAVAIRLDLLPLGL